MIYCMMAVPADLAGLTSSINHVKLQLMNTPNFLTFIRIFAIPVLVVVYYLPVSWNHSAAAIIFALAAFTDWLDGYMARYLQQGTKFGAFLDPVADKLLVAVALVIMVGYMGNAYLAVPAAVIVGREVVISGLREWMAEIGKRTSMAVNWIAKIKTAMQMIALIMLLLYKPELSIYIKVMGAILLYLAAILTLWSMVMYLKIAWPDLTLHKNN